MEKERSNYRYLFGPVPSRRLGRSLGIDLLPPKTCSFNCVYCQLGRTTRRTAERREWTPTADVIREIEDWAESDGQADVATLAGSGEPTLHTGFGDVLAAVGERTSIPSVLLTNGSLFHLDDVRRGALAASVVKVTFSAPDEEVWRKIHRPAEGLRFAEVLEGLRIFRKAYGGELRLEVMVMDGLNSEPGQIQKIAKLAAEIRPDLVQVDTPVRPPTETSVRPVGKERLSELARLFDPPAEVVGLEGQGARRCGEKTFPDAESAENAMADLVLRHPATAEDMAEVFGLSATEVERCLEALTRSGRVRLSRTGGADYYTAPENPE